MVALADVEPVEVDAEPCGMLLMSAKFDDFACINGESRMVKVFLHGDGELKIFSMGPNPPDYDIPNVTDLVSGGEKEYFREKGREIQREKLAWLKQRFETV